jgi:uncharacterized protein (TIGR02996 family)
MSDDRLAFLRAIRADPDDDTARLAFADWLDEHDDPLGAFVRVQLELEPIRYRIDNPRAVELHRREEELLRAHGDNWIGTNQLLTNPADFGPVFRRGLPDYACLSLDTFLKNGEALFDAHPTLREVALYGVANRCSDLTMSPLLARLDALEIADWLTEDDALSLSVSPHLDKIGRFKLWLGGEPWLLHELVRQADSRWPHEIELVQWFGGASTFSPFYSHGLNEEADRVARDANARLGRLAVRVTRPFEQRFPINGDLGNHLCAGRLPDGRPAVAAGSYLNWILVVFTDDGQVQDVTVRKSLVCSASDAKQTADARAALDSTFEEWVVEKLQLGFGVIWVREFTVEDLGIVMWSWSFRLEVTNPTYQESEEVLRRDRGGRARSWLEHRNFVINWGHEYHADWRGKIHSS